MEQLSFIESFRTSPFILTEGAIVERLRHEFHISPDKHIAHAALIYDDSHREILASIYRQYLQIATEFRLPLMLMTPTRRANIEQIAASDYRHKNVLADTMAFLSRFRDEASTPVYIGGLAGCRGNAYDGRYYLSVEEAMEFHFPTVRTLAQSGADYLFAGIMPQLTEAIGMANAMAATGLPYIISFMICRDGRLIDGTFIHDAIGMANAMAATGLPYIISFMICRDGRLIDGTFIHDAIDAIEKETSTRPLCYMANCVHPDVLHQALLHPRNDTPLVRQRFQGIQANAANLSPEELDGCDHLISSSPEELADRLMTLLWDFPLKICGGCCGTNQQHMHRFAEMLAYRRDNKAW